MIKALKTIQLAVKKKNDESQQFIDNKMVIYFNI